MFALVLTLSLMVVVNMVWNMPAKSKKEIVDSWQELARRQTLEQIPLVSENQGSNDGKQVKNPSSIHRLERLDAHESNVRPTKAPFKSAINCTSDYNCMVQDACIEYEPKGDGRRSKYFTIRLFGNESALESTMEKALQNYRTWTSVGFGRALNASTTYSWSTRAAAIVDRFVSRNCGHDLGDEAWPIFRLMRLFSEPNEQLHALYFKSTRPRYCDPVLFPLAEKVYTKHDLPSPDIQCYARIYFGTRGISYMSNGGTAPHRMTTFESDMRAFRAHYYKYANVSSTPRRLDTIVVMEKRQGKHMSNIGNRYEMIDYLKKQFPSFHVKLVTWSDYTIEEQVRLMSRTQAMISLPGSDVMNAIFLPDDGALIMYCRVLGVDGQSGKPAHDNNEWKYWFRHLSYMNALYEPCNSTLLTFNITKASRDTVVDLESLKLRLVEHSRSTHAHIPFLTSNTADKPGHESSGKHSQSSLIPRTG